MSIEMNAQLLQALEAFRAADAAVLTSASPAEIAAINEARRDAAVALAFALDYTAEQVGI